MNQLTAEITRHYTQQVNYTLDVLLEISLTGHKNELSANYSTSMSSVTIVSDMYH